MQPALLRAIVDSAREPLAAFDPQLRHILFNAAYAEHVRAGQGRPPRRGRRLPGGDGSDAARHLRRALAGERQALESLPLPGRPGHRLTDVRLEPVRDDAGAVVAVLLSGRPVATAAGAGDEAPADEARRRLRLALRGAQAGAWERSADGRALAWSEEMHNLYGIEPEAFDGTVDSWLRRVHPDDRARLERQVEDVRASGQGDFAYEFRIHHPQRGLRWMLSQGQVVRDADGRALALQGVTFDITERRLAEDAAHANAVRLQLALTGAQAGSWEWDIPRGRVLWSDEVFALVGQAPRPLTVRKTLACLHPDDRETVTAAIRTLLGGRREDFHIESRVTHPERGVRWLSWIGRVTYADDDDDPMRPLYARGIAIDITERRAMENSLRRARREAQLAKAEAERANLARSKFLAGASHDLRQPVQAMSLLTAVLAGRLRGHPAAPLVAKLNQAQEGLRTMLNTLLDVSRLDAGAVTPEPRPLAIGPFLEDLAVEVLVCAEDKGLRLHAVDCGLWVRSDPALLARILRNLLQNALRYTEAGGIVVGCRRRGDRVRLDVVDSGVGIPPEQHEAIFGEFVQAGTVEGHRQGLGLGLSIVERLARLLDHRLEVASEPGRGSRFSLYLPRAQPAAVAPKAAEPFLEEGPAEPRLVVTIEDDALLRDSLTLMLESWGYEVVAAASAEAALHRLALHGGTPDVVLADYGLGRGETGTEALRRIARRYGDVPSIVITGDTSPQRIVEVLESGFEILHKPLAPSELRQVVARLAARPVAERPPQTV